MLNQDDVQEIYAKNLLEKLTFSPFQKFKHHNRFPWKFILNILLIMGTSYEDSVFLVNYSVNITDRNLLYTLNQQIFGFDNFDYVYFAANSPQMAFTEFLTLTDLINNMKQLLQTMGNLNNIYFTNVDQSKLNQTRQIMECYYWETNIFQDKFDSGKFYFTIEEGIQEPFSFDDIESIKLFIRTTSRIKIIFTNIKFMENPQDDLTSTWDFIMTYDFGFYTVKASLSGERIMSNMDDYNIEKNDYKYYSQNWFIYLTVMILAISSLWLHIKYIFDLVDLYTRTKVISQYYYDPSIHHSRRRALSQDLDNFYFKPETQWSQQFDIRGNKKIQQIIQSKRPWSSLTYKEKLLFIDAWILLAILSNSIQSFTSLILIFPQMGVNGMPQRYLLGLSCFFAWMNICKYIEYIENIYIMTYLLEQSLPTILRYMLGVLPLFIGFAIFGLTLFYRTSYFSSLDTSMISLISMAYGNMVYEVPFFLGESLTATLYTIIFCIIFSIVFQNIFVSIFISMIYDKQEAETKQELMDYLRQKIPNLDQLLQTSKKHDKQSVQQQFSINKTSPKLDFVSPPQDNTKKYFQMINKASKRVQASLKQTLDLVNDDLKIYFMQDSISRSVINRRKFKAMEHLQSRIDKLYQKTQMLTRELIQKTI